MQIHLWASIHLENSMQFILTLNHHESIVERNDWIPNTMKRTPPESATCIHHGLAALLAEETYRDNYINTPKNSPLKFVFFLQTTPSIVLVFFLDNRNNRLTSRVNFLNFPSMNTESYNFFRYLSCQTFSSQDCSCCTQSLSTGTWQTKSNMI